MRRRSFTFLKVARNSGRASSRFEQSWEYFRRADLHKLSAVDVTGFAIVRRAQIRRAYTFDRRFAAAGFKLVT